MSGMTIDEDTKRTVEEGRQTLREFVVALRDEFRKVFVVFAVGMVGTVVWLQYYGWELLRGVTEARMAPAISDQYEIIVRTPFDVILLQVKIGIGVGVLVSLPIFLYLSRDALKERGVWPDHSVPVWKLAIVGLLSIALFVGGMAYGYTVFFPVMFDFLTSYTINVGFTPSNDIVMWAEFILLLTLSFGLAAQLPLVMSALSYLGIVPYETFRDKWRYAILGIFAFGALFSPPDPFTQIMWATPLVALYGVSLYLTRFVTAVKRGGSAEVFRKLRANWNRIAGAFVLFAGAVYLFLAEGYVATLNAALREAPAGFRYQIALEGLPLSGQSLHVALALAWAAVLTLPLLAYYGWPQLEPRRRDPTDLDVDELNVHGVRAAPAALFADMSEQEALAHAQQAMDDDAPAKARAILDRHDAVAEDESEDDGADATGSDEQSGDGTTTERSDNVAEDAARPDNMAEDAAGSRNAGDVAQERAAGIVDAFTEEETTEEDIGGYYYDLAFIFESLTSKAFHVVAVFMLTSGAVFLALYQGGIRILKEDFLSRIPQQVIPPEGVDIVALHPVEAILFEVKLSVVVGLVVTLPVLLYYAWPAIEERFHGITREFETEPPIAAIAAHWNQLAGVLVAGSGLTYYLLASGRVAQPDPVEVAGFAVSGTELGYAAVAVAGLVPATVVAAYHAGASVHERVIRGGKQNVFLVWLVALTGGVVVGSVVGYTFIAPEIISYLVVDAERAGMHISYRINNFFWLIFATTIGIGLLADVPMTMWLFHRGGIVSLSRMRERWREVVVAIFAVSAVATPSSFLTMFLMALPVAVAYLVGLAGLWVVMLPWRVRDRVVELVGGG